MATMDIFKADANGELKEYQTLFWVPMLFQTAKQAETLIDEMLDMIQDFHDMNQKTTLQSRRQSVMKVKGVGNPPKRRQQIFGEAMEAEPTNVTKMDVVMKSDTTRLNLLTVLRRHFLFSQLRDSELDDVVDVMQLYCASEGEVIIQQGEQGETFYIMEEGTVELFKDNDSWGYIEAGNSFGDLALMYNCPRAATIVAKTYCTLWTLDRVFFRQAMVTSSSNQNVQLATFLQKIQLFSSIGVQQLNQLARSLTKQSYDDGQYIIKQGDVGDQFYVVYRGKVIVSKTDDSGNENFLIELHEGEVFGERALIKKEPRKANVRASGPVECYYLESHDFHLMLGEFVEKFNKMNEFRIIRSGRIFHRLSDNRLRELIDLFTVQRVYSGQRVVCNTDMIYIVIEGQFVSSNNEKFAADGIVEVGNLEHGADVVAGALTVLSDEGLLGYFSKDQLFDAIKRQEDDEQRKQRRTSYMDARSRSMLEGGVGGSMLSMNADGSASSGSTLATGADSAEVEIRVTAERRRASAYARRASQADFECHSLADFSVQQLLGKGTFGTVFLCEHNRTGKQIALKCLDKRAIVDNGQHVYVRREIVALSSFSHPFLGEYFATLICRSKVCFVLEYIPGVELWSYLYDETVWLQNTAEHATPLVPGQPRGEFGGIALQDAILYASNILLALEHIHVLGYTYRDLKPENLMIDARNGYLKLIDFGFAKQVPFFAKWTNSVSYFYLVWNTRLHGTRAGTESRS
jgi:CRP-like cAMP-binding protein